MRLSLSSHHRGYRSIGNPVGVTKVDVRVLAAEYFRSVGIGEPLKHQGRSSPGSPLPTPCKAGDSTRTVPRGLRRGLPGAKLWVLKGALKCPGRKPKPMLLPIGPSCAANPNAGARRGRPRGESYQGGLRARSGFPPRSPLLKRKKARPCPGAVNIRLTVAPSGSALMRTDVPAGANRVAVNLPLVVAWATVKVPGLQSKGNNHAMGGHGTRRPGQRHFARRRRIRNTDEGGLGGIIGHERHGVSTHRQHKVRHSCPADLQPPQPGWSEGEYLGGL